MIALEEVVRVAAEVELLKLFGEKQCRAITIDYLPQRGSLWAAREPGEAPSTIGGPDGYSLTYLLEDQMFGGVTYAAVTCSGHVVVRPFRWVSYHELVGSSINVATN